MSKTRLAFPVILLFVLLGIIGSCVKQDFDKPPVGQLPVGQVFTIGELITMFNTTGATQFNYDASVFGIVTMDETSGNIYRSAYIQDATGAINLRLKESGGLRVGDSVRVYLKNVILSAYNNMRQLDNVHNDSNIVILANQKYREPEVVTIPQLLSGNYQAKLVKLENVQFIAGDTSRTYAASDATTNRMIEDCDGKTVIVRTSNFANFAGRNIPNGKGSLVAVAGLFNSTWQLYIRTANEVVMDDQRCGGGGGGGGTAGTIDNPYTVEEAIQKQNATPYVVGWVKGYIVGAVKNGISSVTSAADIDFTAPFSSATNVLIATNANETDYTKCVIVNLPAGTPLRTQVNLLDNPANLKKELKVTGTLRTYFGVAGLRDAPGQVSDFVLAGSGGGGGGGGTGTGTQADPFNIATAIQKQNATPYVVGWVRGFIVGSVKAGISSVSSAADIDWTAPFSSATNVVLADSKTETDFTKCVVVNLPAGSPLRTQVNLLDNPGNYQKWLKVTGTLRTYFGIAGLRDAPAQAADFELETGGGGGGGGTIIFSEEFTTTLGTFTPFSVEGAQVWTWGNFDGGCAVMTGFVNPDRFPNEDWLISPAINLSGHSGVLLNIRQAANFVSGQWDLLQVMISVNYDGTSSPATQGTWTELTIPNRPSGSNWTFVDSGDISLAAYEGQSNVRIAFKYRSTTTIASTWEISKVIVKK